MPRFNILKVLQMYIKSLISIELHILYFYSFFNFIYELFFCDAIFVTLDCKNQAHVV